MKVKTSVTLSEDAALQVVAFDEDGWVRTFDSEAALEHTVTLWGLAPDTTYGWQVEVDGAAVASGSVASDSLPSDLEAANFDVEGEETATDGFVIPLGCPGGAYVVVVSLCFL